MATNSMKKDIVDDVDVDPHYLNGMVVNDVAAVVVDDRSTLLLLLLLLLETEASPPRLSLMPMLMKRWKQLVYGTDDHSAATETAFVFFLLR